MNNYTLDSCYNSVKKMVLIDYPYDISWEDLLLRPYFSECYAMIIEQHSHINNDYYSQNGKGILKLNYIDHYVILGYRFANLLYKNNLEYISEAIYYSMRVRGSIDLFYRTEIPEFFIPAHALGTCMDSHASYGKLFTIYNGVHLGPYDITGKKPSEWEHPMIGDYVKLLANSHVYGKTTIGNNVIVSIGTTIINEEIPDNCIVIGTSPNLHFLQLKIKNSDVLINL